MSDDDDGSQEEVPIQLTWPGMQSGQEVPYMPLPHYSTNWLLPCVKSSRLHLAFVFRGFTKMIR